MVRRRGARLDFSREIRETRRRDRGCWPSRSVAAARKEWSTRESAQSTAQSFQSRAIFQCRVLRGLMPRRDTNGANLRRARAGVTCVRRFFSPPPDSGRPLVSRSLTLRRGGIKLHPSGHKQRGRLSLYGHATWYSA
jgi:hypothetical protein